MEKFLTRKKVIILVVAATITVILSVIAGVNISSSMKNKEKIAQKAKVEQLVNEKNTVDDKIKTARQDNTTVTDVTDIKKDTQPTDDTNKDEVTYTKEYKEYLELSDEEKAKTEVIPRKEEIDFSEIEEIRKDQEENLGKEYVLEEDLEDGGSPQEELPKTFNLKDKINIVVENQGQYGLCWDFASLKSVQTNLQLTQGKFYDLSESHVDYMTSNLMNGYRDENSGGNFIDVISYNNMYNGFVLEDEVPLNVYEDYEYNTFYNIPKEELYITQYVNFPGVRKEDAEYESKLKTLQTAVKTHIMNYGSVYTSIYSPETGVNLYTKDNDDATTAKKSKHAVSIVGWDDNYSKDNFISPGGYKPEHDGAYIALNSWGKEWGNAGYFYISYEDSQVNKELSGITAINDTSKLIKIADLGKNARKYAESKYHDSTVIINGEEYLNPNSISVTFEISNQNIKSLDEFEVFFKDAYDITITNCKVEDISALSKCSNSYLDINLKDNNIKDVSCLRELSIMNLDLTGNYGVKGYENLNITNRLSLRACGVTSVEELKGLKNLQILDLSENRIESLAGITELESLYALELEDCGLKSLEELGNILKMESLCHLDLANNELVDISGLEDSCLYGIDLSYNKGITNYEPLRKSRRIYDVKLVGCGITDAKDVVIEAGFAGGEFQVSDYDDFEGDIDYINGVNYDLSENNGIANLDSLKNANSLKLRKCEINDVSFVKELEDLHELDLSSNHNLYGDMKGKTLSVLCVNDCGLDNNFNVFNIDSVEYLEVRENNINDYAKIEQKVDGSINKGMEDDTVYETKIIEIPDNNVKMNLVKYKNDMEAEDLKINGEYPRYDDLIISVNENTKFTYLTYASGDFRYIAVEFKVNPNMKNDGVQVVYNPYLSGKKSAANIKAEDLKVVNTYGAYIFKETRNFELHESLYRSPAKMVEREYEEGEKSYINVDTKYYSVVVQDKLYAKYTLSSKISWRVKAGEFNIDAINEVEPDVETIKLKFKNRNMYSQMKITLINDYLRADDDLMTIELPSGKKFEFSVLYSWLDDVEALKPIIDTDLTIYMGDANGVDKITEDILKKFEVFENLEKIHIILDSNESDYEVIVPQDKYKVDINGVDIW